MKQAILLPAVVTTMKLLVMKFLKCLLVMEYVDIGLLIPATLPISIAEVVIVVMLVEVDICHKIPDTIFIKNCGVYHFGVDGRGGTRSQDTRHSSYRNCISRVDVEGRCGYKSQTIHSYPRFSGGHVIFSGI